MGVSFELSAAPGAGDSFGIKVDTHQTQNVLDTISKLRAALSTPQDGDATARQNFLASLDSAVGNVSSAINQVSSSVSSIGGRGQALDVQAETNEALGTENAKTQSSIRESDPAEVMVRLQMQTNMLQGGRAFAGQLHLITRPAFSSMRRHPQVRRIFFKGHQRESTAPCQYRHSCV